MYVEAALSTFLSFSVLIGGFRRIKMCDAVVYPPESVYNLLPHEELTNEEEPR